LVHRKSEKRLTENRRALKIAPPVVLSLSIISLFCYRYVIFGEREKDLYPYYAGLLIFTALSSLLFMTVLFLIRKIWVRNVKDVVGDYYFYLLFLVLISLAILNLQRVDDYSFYMVGLIGFPILYQGKWLGYALCSLSGLLYYSFLNALLFREASYIQSLAPLSLMTILSIYLVYSRYKSGKRILDLERKLKEGALKDRLTGFNIRRKLFEILPLRISLFNRYNNKTSILLFEIDMFSKINDLFGYRAGDSVLKRVAQHIREKIRESDRAYRYGDKEFLIILTNTDRDKAVLLGERIRRTIESDNRVPIPWNVTVSIGGAEVRTGDDEDSLLVRAEQNLKDAKNDGRNGVVF